MELRLAPYHIYSFREVVGLWNHCLAADPVTPELLSERMLLDPNFEPAGCTIARDGRDDIVGLSYAVTRRTPLPQGFEAQFARDRKTGWIFALFVHEDYRRQGVGTALLQESLSFLEARGVKHVVLGSYAPHGLLSGVDSDAYPGAREFFARHGFTVTGKSYGMGIDLRRHRKPGDANNVRNRLDTLGQGFINIGYYHPIYLLPTLNFLQESFPTWLSLFTDKLQRGHDHRQMVIARSWEQVIGYGQRGYGRQAERIGPLGVQVEFRGRKIGTLMLHHLLARMAQEGCRLGWSDPVEDRQLAYCERFGYRVLRTYTAMARGLE
jgi:mycothiol synthase